MIMKKRTLLVVALISFLGAAFFLAWAIQTAWIASFPGCNCPQLAYWFYSQLFGFAVLVVIGVALIWRMKLKSINASDAK
ncbi:hypothetical protein [Ralstonia solanacearum]|uniref:hypothetical protein n=1 Tax=Ralstonia solanacearum TaxID=305 RepID=UPI0001D9814C|nr:hypothetical protein [Ralstonia solanacearum]CBJ52576.1 exported protein of unknown function [Ralstonia solanacearum PSI07]